MARKKRSRAEWTRLVNEMVSTGASVTEFARQNKLNASTLSNWRWRLRREASVQAEDGTSFVEVAFDVPMARPTAHGVVVATLPNGVTLQFEHELGGLALRELVEAVGGAECGR